MSSCMVPISSLTPCAPSPWVYWLGSSPFRVVLHPALLKFSPAFGNGRGLHRTRCRILVRRCLFPKRVPECQSCKWICRWYSSRSEGPHTLKNNYLHADSWPYSRALLKVRIQRIFYCSVEELASTILKCTIYSVSCYFCKKKCLISLSKCQNEVE